MHFSVSKTETQWLSLKCLHVLRSEHGLKIMVPEPWRFWERVRCFLKSHSIDQACSKNDMHISCCHGALWQSFPLLHKPLSCSRSMRIAFSFSSQSSTLTWNSSFPLTSFRRLLEICGEIPMLSAHRPSKNVFASLFSKGVSSKIIYVALCYSFLNTNSFSPPRLPSICFPHHHQH